METSEIIETISEFFLIAGYSSSHQGIMVLYKSVFFLGKMAISSQRMIIQL